MFLYIKSGLQYELFYMNFTPERIKTISFSVRLIYSIQQYNTKTTMILPTVFLPVSAQNFLYVLKFS